MNSAEQTQYNRINNHQVSKMLFVTLNLKLYTKKSRLCFD